MLWWIAGSSVLWRLHAEALRFPFSEPLIPELGGRGQEQHQIETRDQTITPAGERTGKDPCLAWQDKLL